MYRLLPLALLAALALALLAAVPAAAQPTEPPPAPEVLDEPPVFAIDYPPDTDVTVRIVWDEVSDAPRRTLNSSRRGLLYYDPGPRLEFYVVYVDLDQWRPGDSLTLCRSWDEGVTSCHTSTPWPRNSVFLPLLAP